MGTQPTLRQLTIVGNLASAHQYPVISFTDQKKTATSGHVTALLHLLLLTACDAQQDTTLLEGSVAVHLQDASAFPMVNTTLPSARRAVMAAKASAKRSNG